MTSKYPSLFISSDFPPVSGGQSNFLFGLWTSLPPDETVILAPKVPGSNLIDYNLSCLTIRKKWPLGNNSILKIMKTFLILIYVLKIRLKINFKNLHCGQLFATGFVGLFLKKIIHMPYTLYVHGADLLEFRNKFLLGKVLRKILFNADNITVNSKFTKIKVLESGVKPEIINVINPGINMKDFEIELDVENFKKELNVEKKKIILTVSRLVERKGHDVVLSTMPRIIKEIPNVHYLIIGDGPYKTTLEKLTDKMYLNNHVTFLGFMPDSEIPKYYAICDILVMVSREIKEKGDVEGFGIVYLEANAMKKPVIAGRSGGVEDAVEDGVNGLLVDPKDIDQIGGAIIRLLKDDDLRNKLGEKGYQRVKEKFDWKNRREDSQLLLNI
jgi:phosphatidylinositol alpha-1,6-mannosyltransferase